ncbi:hypothetical protein B9Z55_026803 [Caenorhabditis nigoni]|nr:hypothetical protein B9Z55_026803 [Caenorhabditis nigoni]
MTQILDNVGFLGILNLRKTCKYFRNLIDDVKPNNDLKKINIFLEHHLLTVSLVFDKNGNSKNEGTVTVVYKEGGYFDGNFVDAMLNDIESILKNQRSKLTDLEIMVDSFTYCEGYMLFSFIKIRFDFLLLSVPSIQVGYKNDCKGTKSSTYGNGKRDDGKT